MYRTIVFVICLAMLSGCSTTTVRECPKPPEELLRVPDLPPKLREYPNARMCWPISTLLTASFAAASS